MKKNLFCVKDHIVMLCFTFKKEGLLNDLILEFMAIKYF